MHLFPICSKLPTILFELNHAITLYLYCIQCALRPIDINFADVEGYTALHYACMRGHQQIAEILLKAGAHVRTRYVA